MKLDVLNTIENVFLRQALMEVLSQSVNCTTMREQMAFIHRPIMGSVPPLELIGSVFSLSRGTVYNHIHRFEKEQKIGGQSPQGRPPRLSTEVMVDMQRKISDDYAAHIPCTYHNLARWLYDTHCIEITPDVLRHIVKREQSLKVVKAVPMEDKRVLCDTEDIDSYLEALQAMGNNRPACLVANLDEMGYLEYQDQTSQVVVVPEYHKGKNVQLMVDRSKRRMTILQCIFADQTTAPPLIVLSRKTVEKELYDFGLTPDKCMFAYQENGFITTDIFMEWSTKFLIPEFHNRISRFNGEDVEARGLLLMDGLKQHFSDFFEDECFIHDIDILELPAHSSDQTQPLDLCIFAACKKIMPRCISDGATTQTKDVDRLVSAMHAASTPHNIRKSFRRAGISLHWVGDACNGILMCRVDLSHCDRIRHLAVSTPETASERRTLSLTREYIPLAGTVPDRFRATMAEEITLLNQPCQIETNWRLDDNFQGGTMELLEAIFPSGTDELVSEENRAKVRQWKASRQAQSEIPQPFFITLPTTT